MTSRVEVSVEVAMLMPLLSDADPKDTSEGSLDPLGLYPIADDLGLKLIPGVRERQKHPRFLTSIAVSLAVCREFAEDTVAKDGMSEPWLVFEWLLTEGLVRQAADRSELAGLPGSQKVRQAVFRDERPISAKNYLKTPSVFGFHGVYRLLARTLGIERHGRLWEEGYRLLEVWSDEQGLPGFLGSASGEGTQCMRMFRRAVAEGLERGYSRQSPNWLGWMYLGRHLSVYGGGPREKKLLRQLLVSAGEGHRREVLEFLISEAGRKRWSAAEDSERTFHRALRKQATNDLRDLLEAIDDYELFARRMQDAFDDCLREMTETRGRTGVATMSRLKNVNRAASEVSAMFARLKERLAVIGGSNKFQEQFGEFAEPTTDADFVSRLLEHHRRTQRRKPPHGKAPWFERFDDGSYVIRPGYFRDAGGIGGDEYVHAYRTRSLWTFAKDLGLVK